VGSIVLLIVIAVVCLGLGAAGAFAFVVAGLWQGRLDTLWLRRARPWTLAAWYGAGGCG